MARAARAKDYLNLILTHRQLWFFIFTPLLLLPMALLIDQEIPNDNNPDQPLDGQKVAQFGYILIIVATFWIFDVLPISVTALLPYVLLPSFGLLDSSVVAASYMSNTNMLLIGGFMVAISIEETNLHRRIALGALKLVGSNPRALMFGFMFITWILSMCIANTSTTALMVPIVISVLDQLHESERQQLEDELQTAYMSEENMEKMEPKAISKSPSKTSLNSTANHPTDDAVAETDLKNDDVEEQQSIKTPENVDNDEEDFSRSALDIGLLLSVPFAASIGGTGTFTGTDLNLYLAGFYKDYYKEYASPGSGYQDITYTNWAMYALLPSFLTFFISYIWLQAFAFGFNPLEWFTCGKNEGAERVINEEYIKLGKMKQGEYIALSCFLMVVILWVTRDPDESVDGWAELFPIPGYMTDGMSVILIGILLFVLPIGESGLFAIFNCFKSEENKVDVTIGPSKPILNWPTVQRKTGWGVLILIGGGYAIAAASDESGFSDWVANNLAKMVEGWDAWVICLLCSVMASLFTEVTSNSAACALFVPLLNKLALNICVHPLYLTLPATIACSMSFMLPAATPPNAIAFGTGRLRTIDSIKAGFFPKIVGVGLINVFVNWFGPLIYNTDVYPCFALGDLSGRSCFDPDIHCECPDIGSLIPNNTCFEL